jgi:hypothetical protein
MVKKKGLFRNVPQGAIFAALFVLSYSCSLLFAEEQNPTQANARLSKIFGFDGIWCGEMKAGAFGPKSPAMPTKGSCYSKLIADGMWYTCDMSVTAGSGTNSFTWKGHMIVGWNSLRNSYTAYLFDNLDIILPMTGILTSSNFILTSTAGNPISGKKTFARFTWDFSSPGSISFKNEHRIGNGAWFTFETETIKPRN